MCKWLVGYFSSSRASGRKAVVVPKCAAPRRADQDCWFTLLQITKADDARNSDLTSHSLCCDFKNQIKLPSSWFLPALGR